MQSEERPLNRAEKRARTRQKLLESAAEVFAKQGYERASVDDIAEHAGYSKGAVYSNFDSKEELFLALYDMLSEQAFRSAADVDAANPVEAIVAEGRALFHNLIEPGSGWPLLLMEFWTYAARHPVLREKVAERSEQRRAELARLWKEQADRAGVQPASGPEEIASAAMAVSNGIALQMILYPERVTNEYVDGIWRAIAMAFLNVDGDAKAE